MWFCVIIYIVASLNLDFQDDINFFLVQASPLVEDVLTCGLPAKLMHYLCIRVLGDASQRDTNHLVDNKNASTRGRDES